MDTSIITSPAQQLTRPLDYTTQQIIKEAIGSLQAFPVNAVYLNISGTNPGTELGYGTWASFGAGKALVGVDTGDSNFNTVLKTGGESTHTLTLTEIPSVSPTIYVGNTGSGNPSVSPSSGFGATTAPASSGYIPSFGGGGAHNNLQPYITVYFWKRTA